MASEKFVSRGGEKLQAAISHWQLAISNLACLDVGSSTGGFVDCILQNGAAKVYSVDTAYGELAWKLRNDRRVIVMERTNILYLEKLPSPVIPDLIGNLDPPIELEDDRGGELEDDNILVDLITIDAGWTRLELILPVVKKFLKEDGKITALLKPHYETDQKNLVKGVVPEDMVEQIKEKVLTKIKELGFKIENQMDSPILGGGGNREFLILLIPVSGK